jgi:CubicO group peptidase (beta-lactamase class C family)
MSAHSLSIFLQMFLENGFPLLQSSSINEIRKIIDQNSAGSSSTQYGLIWYWQTTSNGRRIFGHDGALAGMTNAMFMNEQGTIGVIILTNGDVTLGGTLSQTILNTIETVYVSFFDCFENNAAHSFSGSIVKSFLLSFVLFSILLK